MQLNEIYAPISQELIAVEEGLKSVAVVDAPWMDELLAYALKGGGKRLRPALAILSAKFHDFNMPRLLPLTTSVELMHMATLVHDDTIDNSSKRWGRKTINKIWGMEKAILLGDYLFAKAGYLTASTENIRVIKLLSETLMIITNGELAQAASSFHLNQSREHYYFRISCKTAALFVMATESGAVLSSAPETDIQVVRDYGYNLGIAFQIIDDVLDYIGTEEEMGKPVGSDLSQGTLTLPGLMLMERYPADNPVKKLFENRQQTEYIGKTIEMVRNSDIIAKCFDVTELYRQKACTGLAALPPNEARESMLNLADFIVNRRR